MILGKSQGFSKESGITPKKNQFSAGIVLEEFSCNVKCWPQALFLSESLRDSSSKPHTDFYGFF